MTVLNMNDFPHDTVGFSLQGHASKSDESVFTCADCHPQGFTTFDMSVCETCHREIDTSYIETHLAYFGLGCLACHDGVDTYGDTFDHNLLSFPLEGGHAQLGCSECHPAARTRTELQIGHLTCYTCHEKDDAHAGGFGENCDSCHIPTSWDQATFDHTLSAFPLTDAHLLVECAQCHVGAVYAGTPIECVSCHGEDDAHAGGFGENCGACHTPTSWDQATFDHTLSTFPLTGAHILVECAQCHVGGAYTGTPTACVGCHGDPDFHVGLFGTDCVACHTTEAWSPALFNKTHSFPIDHGATAWSECKVCHPDSLFAYTCYGCHDHTPAGVESKHREEGITDFLNCVECHPTGREEEGGGGEGDD